MQGQGIDLRQQLMQRQAIGAWRSTGDLPQQHAHTESLGQLGDRAAQFAMAQQAEGLAVEFDDGEVQQTELLGPLPLAGRDLALVIGQSGRQGQQQHQGVLGHRGGAVALAIAHGDTELARRFQVDVVGAGGRHQHQFQIRAGLQGRGVQVDLVADGYRYAAQALDQFAQAPCWGRAAGRRSRP